MKLILILIAALSVYFSKKRKGSESIKNSQDNNQLLKSKIWKNKDFQHLYPEASKQLKRLSLKKKGHK